MIAFPAADVLTPALAELAAKGALLLALGGLAAAALRRASAASRHVAWAAAISATLALPALSAVVPAARIVRIPAAAALAPNAAAGREMKTVVMLVDRHEADGATGCGSTRSRSDLVLACEQPVEVPWSVVVLLVWGAGCAAVFAWLAGGAWALRQMRRRAVAVTDDAWLALSADVARRLGVRRKVTLLRLDDAAVPMTWGTLRPVLLLPGGCDAWCAERRRVVLAHELAHVRRRDVLTRWMAHAVVALHWFDPLAWMAARALAEESERACDDAVLALGTRPSAYAAHLLDVARALAGRRAPVAALAMARRARISARVDAILAVRRRAHPGRRTPSLALAASLAAAVPVAALKPADVRAASRISRPSALLPHPPGPAGPATAAHPPRADRSARSDDYGLASEAASRSSNPPSAGSASSIPASTIIPASTLPARSSDATSSRTDGVPADGAAPLAGGQGSVSSSAPAPPPEAAAPVAKPVAPGQEWEDFRSGGWVSTSDGTRRLVDARGVLLAPGRGEVAALRPGGWLDVRETVGSTTRSLVALPAPDGQPRYVYRVNGTAAEFGPAARAWLANVLRNR
ncbi:MAG TPA: M56 family metallopeptidase [Longimicrobiaceae bacterium]|jgi:beta-lactamase regulating signal transducer with metallopeptidase domain|nr:M56 family metallopeptidase [Longimicrobiaceae bacterium]